MYARVSLVQAGNVSAILIKAEVRRPEAVAGAENRQNCGRLLGGIVDWWTGGLVDRWTGGQLYVV